MSSSILASAFKNILGRRLDIARQMKKKKKSYIESLEDLPLDPEPFDVIVSNRVVNLATNKQAVLRCAFNLLKPGGGIYFFNIYADR